MATSELDTKLISGEVMVGEVGIYTGRNPDPVRADVRFISVFRSPTELLELGSDETFTLAVVLPGFELPLSQLFREEK